MKEDNTEEIKIINTTKGDLAIILELFKQAIELQSKNGYKVWHEVDGAGLQKDIDNGLQYKIVKDNQIKCIFSIQYSDPFIWRYRNHDAAIYLHRIVANPKFRGQQQFKTVLNWTVELARLNKLRFVRIDTWADNKKIINYYKSFGFKFIENYKTPDTTELPIQNRNLNVALLQIEVWG